jgi:hypothetical protein
MVPLEKVLKQPRSDPERPRARPGPKPKPRPSAPEPVPPRRFRVIDALSREVVLEDANALATLELLRGVAQPVEVSIYVWEHRAGKWRLLTNGERRLLWEHRARGLTGDDDGLSPRP